jgi:acetyl esterase/lipase
MKKVTRRFVWLAIGGVLALSGCAGARENKTTADSLASCSVSPNPTIPLFARMVMPKIPLAVTIAPSDNSTSIVIKPDPTDQIRCGNTQVKLIKDVVYGMPTTTAGKTIKLAMDIMVPAGAGNKPAIVYVPGGGFMISAKESAGDLRQYVAESGFIVVSIQYRTVNNGQATYRETIQDVKSSVRYLRAHSAEYGIDGNKIGVWGESAGGYLAAMLGVTGGVSEFDVGDGLAQSSKVQAVVDKFGASDLSKIVADFEPAQQSQYGPGTSLAHFVNGPNSTKGVLDNPAAINASNPLTYVDASDSAFLLFHGSADGLVSPSQTLILHNALKSAGIDSTRYVLEGSKHGDMAFMGDREAGKPWSTTQVMNIIVNFFHRHLG